MNTSSDLIYNIDRIEEQTASNRYSTDFDLVSFGQQALSFNHQSDDGKTTQQKTDTLCENEQPKGKTDIESNKRRFKEQFFKAYASHLRVATKIEDMCKLKSQLKLPSIAKIKMDKSPREEGNNMKKAEKAFTTVKAGKVSILERLLSDSSINAEKPDCFVRSNSYFEERKLSIKSKLNFNFASHSTDGQQSELSTPYNEINIKKSKYPDLSSNNQAKPSMQPLNQFVTESHTDLELESIRETENLTNFLNRESVQSKLRSKSFIDSGTQSRNQPSKTLKQHRFPPFGNQSSLLNPARNSRLQNNPSKQSENSSFIYHSVTKTIQENVAGLASHRSLPQSPLNHRKASFGEFIVQHHQVKLANRRGTLSPVDKNQRVQQLLKSQSSNTEATQLLSSKKPPFLVSTRIISSSTLKDGYEVNSQRKTTNLEKELTTLERRLSDKGVFQSVDERNKKSKRSLSTQTQMIDDPMIRDASIKALEHLVPGQIAYSYFQTHADAINTDLFTKLSKATDIMMEQVFNQSTEVIKTLQVLDFMQSQKKKQFLDYFEAQRAMHNTKKKKPKETKSLSETQDLGATIKSKIETNHQSVPTVSSSLSEVHPNDKVTFDQSKVPQQPSIINLNSENQISLSHRNSLLAVSALQSQSETPKNKGSKTTKAKQATQRQFQPLHDQTILEEQAQTSPSIKSQLSRKEQEEFSSFVQQERNRKGSIGDHTEIIKFQQSLSGSINSSVGARKSQLFKQHDANMFDVKEESSSDADQKTGKLKDFKISIQKPTMDLDESQSIKSVSSSDDTFSNSPSPDNTLTPVRINIQLLGTTEPTSPLTTSLLPAIQEQEEIVTQMTQEDTNSDGVHALKVSDSDVGIYTRLRQDVFVLKSQSNNALDSYDLNFQPSRMLIEFCEFHRRNGTMSLNPYPILHQLYQGRLFVKGQKYPVQGWKQLFKTAQEFSHHYDVPLRFICLDNCEIGEEAIDFLIKNLSGFRNLKEIILSGIQLSQLAFTYIKLYYNNLTTQSTSLNSTDTLKKTFITFLPNNAKVKFLFYQCQLAEKKEIKQWFIDHDNNQPPEVTHPLLNSNKIVIRQLCLSNCQLVDDHLQLIAQRLVSLESLDISFNNLSADKLLLFLQEIIQVATQRNSNQAQCLINSLNISGNSMAKAVTFEVNKTLPALVKLKSISHVDLSLMDLDTESIKEIMKALKYARSIQSVHLSGAKVKQLKLIAQEVLGHIVFDRIVMHRIPQDVSPDWNDQLKLPNTKEDITPQVNSCLCNQRTKTEHVKKVNAEALKTEGPLAQSLNYSDNRYVLSRIIGRPDLSNHFERLKITPVQSDCIDVTRCDPLLQREFDNKRRNLDEICWVESQECWCCERWSYLLPIISQNHIFDCFPGEEQEKERLNIMQEKTLSKIIAQNTEVYKQLEQRVPYIVGECTSFEFIKLQNFTDFMLMIDPEGTRVAKKKQNRIQRQQHYVQDDFWRQVLKQSQIKQRRVPRPGNTTLYPYEPHISISKNVVLGIYEDAWAGSFMVRPGKTSYFVVYKFDATRTFKTEVNCEVSPRALTMHHTLLPKVKAESKKQEKNEKKVDDYYINILTQWKQETPHRLMKVIEMDLSMWRLKQTALFRHGQDVQYQQLVEQIKQYREKLYTVHKELQSNSDTYVFPHLTSVDLIDWCTHIQIFNNNFTTLDFLALFKEVKIGAPQTLNFLNTQSVPAALHASQSLIQQKMQRVNSKLSSVQKIKQLIQQEEKKDSELQKGINRYQWIDLLVRIALKKFRMTENQNKMIILSPAECFNKLMAEHVMPYFHRVSKRAERFKTFMDELMANREIQKYLFLNQFELNNVYNQYFKEEYQVTYEYDEPNKIVQEVGAILKKRMSIKVPKKSIDSSYQGLTPLLLRQLNNTKNFTSLNSPLKPTLSQYKRISQNKSSSRILSTNIRESSSSGLSKESEIQSPGFPASILAKLSKVQSVKLPASISTGGNSSIDHKSSLERRKEIYTEKGLSNTKLAEKCLKFLPTDKAHVFSKKLFYYCFVQSKQLELPTGNDLTSLNNDSSRNCHLNFIEFVVFVCFFGVELARLYLAVGDGKFEIKPYIKEIIQLLLEQFKSKSVEVPPEAEDKRGVHPLQLLIHGQLVDYSPPTPERFRESMNAADLFSSDEEDKPELFPQAVKKRTIKQLRKKLTTKLLVGTVDLTQLKKDTGSLFTVTSHQSLISTGTRSDTDTK